VLKCLLPQFVRDRVKEGARYIAEEQGEVTILFCFIMDFDKICSIFEPKELTDWLDEFFQKLDNICEANGVTKIETVSNTYMACAGLKDSEANLAPEFLSISHTRRCL
jgi:class 3 adenylate cyclase